MSDYLLDIISDIPNRNLKELYKDITVGSLAGNNIAFVSEGNWLVSGPGLELIGVDKMAVVESASWNVLSIGGEIFIFAADVQAQWFENEINIQSDASYNLIDTLGWGVCVIETRLDVFDIDSEIRSEFGDISEAILPGYALPSEEELKKKIDDWSDRITDLKNDASSSPSEFHDSLAHVKMILGLDQLFFSLIHLVGYWGGVPDGYEKGFDLLDDSWKELSDGLDLKRSTLESHGLNLPIVDWQGQSSC